MNMPNTKRRALVENAIRALEDDQGCITPENVIDVARDPRSALHSEFEWDDAKAGHAHRLDQARVLIRSVKVVVTIERHTIAAPYYVRDPNVQPAEQGYVALERIQKDPQGALAMLNYEFTRANAHLTRAEEIAEAVGMKADLAAAIRNARAASKKIEKTVKRLKDKGEE
jgi:ribosome-associated translation inhibitor RaiA